MRVGVRRSGGGELGRLRVRRRHGHVRGGRRLEWPQRRMWHASTAIGRRGYRRVRRLGVAIVAVRQRCKRRAAMERWQRGQLVLVAIVGLLSHRRVLGQARLAEAVSMVHYMMVVVGMLGEVLSKNARPIVVVIGEVIRRTSSPNRDGGR